MKLSLALSALLLGGAVIMSGCGTSSDSTPADSNTSAAVGDGSGTAGGDTNESSAPAFTTAMLAGKTFYTYGLWVGGQEAETENRFVVTFNADASGCNVHNHSDSEGDTFSVNGTNSINDGKMHWHTDGMSDMTATAVKIFEDGSFIATMIDPDHYDPYAILFSTTERADKGQTVFDDYLAAQTMDKATITANPWYSLDWSELDNSEGGGVLCHALFTFKSDNAIDVAWVDESGHTQTMTDFSTYVISGNRLEFDTPNGEGEVEHTSMFPIVKDSDHIIWSGDTAYFKNRADAETFLNYIDPENAAACMANFPE